MTSGVSVVFVDFDDTLFPSSALAPYFRQTTNTFEIPPKVSTELKTLDRLIAAFLDPRLVHTRFRIVTHATYGWVHAALHLMPLLQRKVLWNYLDLNICASRSKYEVIGDLVARDTCPDLYGALGDSDPDVDALHVAVAHFRLATVEVQTIKFVSLPKIYHLQHEWSCLPQVWEDMTRLKEQRRHFQKEQFVQQETIAK
jgi:hypothetical protein